jgi:hypothetical protein
MGLNGLEDHWHRAAEVLLEVLNISNNGYYGHNHHTPRGVHLFES